MDALVPLKRLDQAKSRLRECLEPAARVMLMRSLLDRTMREVRSAPSIGRVILVSSDGESATFARRHDAVHFDDRGLPWNDALAAAMREAVTSGSVLILSADLPFVTAEEIEAFVSTVPDPGIAVARARDGGTNGVVMRPPAVVRTCFGTVQSAAGHAALAAAADVRAVVVDIPGLQIDLDSPSDLADVLRREGSDRIRAIVAQAGSGLPRAEGAA